MYTRGMVLMNLDRGTLARIDRALLSRLGHDHRYQTLRVPASEALWSAWRRYCGALGISMGRAVAALIVYELGATNGRDPDEEPAYALELENRLLARSEELDLRERRLEERERSVREAERYLRARTVPLPSDGLDIGRNDPCPCGSGLKYKRCHGFLV